jgi:hypothetical protein
VGRGADRQARDSERAAWAIRGKSAGGFLFFLLSANLMIVEPARFSAGAEPRSRLRRDIRLESPRARKSGDQGSSQAGVAAALGHAGGASPWRARRWNGTDLFSRGALEGLTGFGDIGGQIGGHWGTSARPRAVVRRLKRSGTFGLKTEACEDFRPISRAGFDKARAARPRPQLWSRRRSWPRASRCRRGPRCGPDRTKPSNRRSPARRERRGGGEP